MELLRRSWNMKGLLHCFKRRLIYRSGRSKETWMFLLTDWLVFFTGIGSLQTMSRGLVLRYGWKKMATISFPWQSVDSVSSSRHICTFLRNMHVLKLLGFLLCRNISTVLQQYGMYNLLYHLTRNLCFRCLIELVKFIQGNTRLE